jgi:hypothetical protein
MQIGQTKTKSGKPRVTLEWWAQDRSGRPYPRRVVRLTHKEHGELVQKTLDLCPADRLLRQYQYMTGTDAGNSLSMPRGSERRLIAAAEWASYQIADLLQRAGEDEHIDTGDAVNLLTEIRTRLDKSRPGKRSGKRISRSWPGTRRRRLKKMDRA